MNQVLFTIATLLLTTNCECLFWNNGNMELEDPARNFEETDSTLLPHFLYTKAQVRDLRDFLNSSEITAILEQ